MKSTPKYPKLREDLQVNQLDPSHYSLLDPRTGASLELDSAGYLVAEQFENGDLTIPEAQQRLLNHHALRLREDEIFEFLRKADQMGLLETPLSQLGMGLENIGKTSRFAIGSQNESNEELDQLRSELKKTRSPFHAIDKKVWIFYAVLAGVFLFPWKLRVKGPLVIAASQYSYVRAPTSGTIEEALVQEGERVQVGQPLISFHGERSVDRATIQALMPGVVLTPQTSLLSGKKVQPGDLVLEIADLSRLSITVKLDEKDVALIQDNSPLIFKMQAFPEETFRVSVNRIAPVAETDDAQHSIYEGRFVRVYAAIDNPNGRLKPGMTGVGQIMVGWRMLGTIILRQVYRYIRVTFVV